ncbi:glycosyltransferase family 4 protein [Clostridium lundense]|uniref:glycosyltransferase family 4 protein n=1 Tax=Clostridium lundense TaxID=319475 RepID=UPI0004851884|nr:glycosyltransferase family 4 protein [Clostridium lundense]
MKNLLLVFQHSIQLKHRFYEMINEFDRQGYYVHIYDDMHINNFSIDYLPYLIDYYKKEYNDLNKIVVLSNCKDILFSWFRVYNSLIDDFIYFIDNEEQNFYKKDNDLYDFINSISNFASINEEVVQGKIYININLRNYFQIYRFMMKNNNFQYFDIIKNFDYNNKNNKTILNKKYIYNNCTYYFNIAENKDDYLINLSNFEANEININQIFIDKVHENIFILPYITINFYNYNNMEVNRFLFKIFTALTDIELKYRKYIFNVLFDYVQMEDIGFNLRLYIVSLLAVIYPENSLICEYAMKIIINDKNNIKYHYEFLWQIISWICRQNLGIYDDYYLDITQVIDKLANPIFNYIEKEKISFKKDINNIAIVTDQLLGIKHSPTKVIIDYAISIKKYYPKYNVKIFVEDNLYCKKIGEIIPHIYSSYISQNLKSVHYDYIKNSGVEIYYCDVEKNKDEQVTDLLENISKFSPEIILTNSENSLVTRVLYNYYKIVYMSTGGNYFSTKAHKYLCGNRDEVIRQNSRYLSLNEGDIIQFNYGLNLDSKIRKQYLRKDFNLKENDFVMVTVGSRLNSEMDKEFIENICSFIKENPGSKWLIVGNSNINEMNMKYSDLIDNSIIRVNFEDDLNAVYSLCDIYINPKRSGGGISIAMAMNMKLPIIIFSEESDGLMYVGKENAVGSTFDEYINEVTRLYLDVNYRKDKGKIMKEIVGRFQLKNSINQLIEIFNNINIYDK